MSEDTKVKSYSLGPIVKKIHKMDDSRKNKKMLTQIPASIVRVSAAVLFITVSIVLHFILIEGIYRFSHSNIQPDRVTTIKRVPEAQKVSVKTLSVATEKNDYDKPAKPGKKPGARKLSRSELEALGKSFMPAVKKGEFPSLIISYIDPIKYIQDLYALGARTIIYNKNKHAFLGVDLIKNRLFSIDKSDLKEFSLFKRVIKDSKWNRIRKFAATEMNISEATLDIVLLVPMSVEVRWIGHQVNLLRNANIRVSEVESIDAIFQHGKLKVKRVWLQNGEVKKITDIYGV